MNKIRVISAKNITKDEISKIVALTNATWPSKDKNEAELCHEMLEIFQKMPTMMIFTVWDGQKLIANTEIFARTIKFDEKELKIMALASVCVDPERRGEGLGRQLIERAFKHVDDGKYPLSLYQTQIPSFYEKFGAKQVKNTFINTKNSENPEKCPWWDPYIMIYPNNPIWPSGTIDLNGPGY